MVLGLSAGLTAGTILTWIQHSDGSTSGAPSTAAHGNPYDLLEWVGPNPDLKGLLAESEVVVLGRFVEVADVEIVLPNGYDPNDAHLPAGQSPGVPFTNLIFEVDEYLFGGGEKRLIVTQTGDLKQSEGHPQFPRPSLNETQILFLTSEARRGPNVWASNRGPFGRIREQDGELIFGSGAPRAVSYMAGKSLDDLKAEIRAIAP